MRILKKLLAVTLCVLMLLGTASVCASAAAPSPTFELKIKETTKTEVVLEFSLVSGSVSSFDVKFNTSSALGECKSFDLTTDFINLVVKYIGENQPITNASNPLTQKFSLAASKAIDAEIALFDITYERKTAEDITLDDFNAEFGSCVVIYNSQNVDVASSVKLEKSLGGFITFNTTEISGNYKDVKKIGYTTNYSKDKLEWSSSNPKVATVDENGKVTMTGKGTATVTAKSADGTAQASCKVTVEYSTLQWIIIIVLFGWIWYI